MSEVLLAKRILLVLLGCGVLCAEPIQVPVDESYSLPGRLDVPREARGVVVLVHGSGVNNMDEDEASLPSSAQLVRDFSLPIVFLQGDFDNQTPAYFMKALELVETHVWKKGNKRFVYFPRCGHALDPRDRYDDIVYRRPERATLEKAADELIRFWVGR